MKIILIIFVGAFFISCQQKPTQAVSESPVLLEASPKVTQAWFQKLLKEDPVILDARSPFDFNMAHVPSAINVRWEDFSQQDPNSRGLLDSDYFALARRLSLIGVDPDRKVLVLGKGLQGNGEEGRIAWTLEVLGVKNVVIADARQLRALRVQDDPSPQNKPYWKPVVDDSLTVRFDLFKMAVMGEEEKASFPSKARVSAMGAPAGMLVGLTEMNIFGQSVAQIQKKLVVIDVRTKAHFEQENLTQKKGVTARVVNIQWADFFDERGMVSATILDRLQTEKITKDSAIFVISNYGVESAAVTYALRILGFRQTANFAGGYEQWNVKK